MPCIFRCTVLVGSLLLAAPGHAADRSLHFRPACDFRTLSVTLREAPDINPQTVTLSITLQPEVRDRLAARTRARLGQSLALYIDDVYITTAIVHDGLTTDRLQLAVDRATAQKIFPALLATNCPRD